MTKRKITPHKGGRTVSRRCDVTPQTDERLRILKDEHGVSLGDLVEAAARDMLALLEARGK